MGKKEQSNQPSSLFNPRSSHSPPPPFFPCNLLCTVPFLLDVHMICDVYREYNIPMMTVMYCAITYEMDYSWLTPFVRQRRPPVSSNNS